MKTSLNEILQAAITDLVLNGFESEVQVSQWIAKIYAALTRYDKNLPEARKMVMQRFLPLFNNFKPENTHKGIPSYTLQRLRPVARLELDKRIRANAELIKLDRENAINDTLNRFRLWSVSQLSGEYKIKKKSVKEILEYVKKPFDLNEDYIKRRLDIDQAHKLIAAINEVYALDGGAIAVQWVQNYSANPRNADNAGKSHRFDADKNHQQFDGKIFVFKNSSPVKNGLIKNGNTPYYENLGTALGKEINCSCDGIYFYNLLDLYNDKPDCFTNKGLAEVKKSTG